MSKRVLLKISGESLSGIDGANFDAEAIEFISGEIRHAVEDTGMQLAIVIGGGNQIRGSRLVKELNTTPVISDQAGMLATIINGIILQDFLENKHGVETRVMSAVEVNEFVEPYLRRPAMTHLERGRVVILVGGSGNPRFTTDSAAVLRAIEINADMAIKGTKVEGIYDKDPNIDSDAKFIKTITHKEFADQQLGIMDRTAVTLAGENKVDVRVFNIFEKGNLAKVLAGDDIGSLIRS